ncbi:MAG: hypothetical protein FJ351_01345 [Sphingomonadales bacterium]|nr:hypothetical protein [Sphingomonadales bacterium]
MLIEIPDRIGLRIKDVAKASDSTAEEVAEQFLKAMLEAWEPHLIKDSEGNVIDLFEEEVKLWAEESGDNDSEGWKKI